MLIVNNIYKCIFNKLMQVHIFIIISENAPNVVIKHTFVIHL